MKLKRFLLPLVLAFVAGCASTDSAEEQRRAEEEARVRQQQDLASRFGPFAREGAAAGQQLNSLDEMGSHYARGGIRENVPGLDAQRADFNRQRQLYNVAEAHSQVRDQADVVSTSLEARLASARQRRAQLQIRADSIRQGLLRIDALAGTPGLNRTDRNRLISMQRTLVSAQRTVSTQLHSINSAMLPLEQDQVAANTAMVTADALERLRRSQALNLDPSVSTLGVDQVLRELSSFRPGGGGGGSQGGQSQNNSSGATVIPLNRSGGGGG